MDFTDENRARFQCRVCGTRSFRSHGPLSRSTGNIHDTARLLASRKHKACFFTRASTTSNFVQINFIAIRAQIKAITKHGFSRFKKQITLGRNNGISAADSPLFTLQLGFKFPAFDIDRSIAIVVEFNPAICSSKNIRLDFVQANSRSIENLIVSRARITIGNSTCPPRSRVGFVTRTLIHERSAVTVSKARPRRFITESCAHVTFALELDIDNIAFIHEFCNSTRLRVLIPRSKDAAPSRQILISLLEQVNIVCHDDILTIFQRLCRECKVDSTI